MRLDSGRIVRNVICLVSLLAFASTPLLAQQGIDLLDPEQVLRATEQLERSDGTTTVRATLDVAPNGVLQATHEKTTLQYDDDEFENFEEDSTLEPVATGSGDVEWAQRFELKADSAVVSARVCFQRPKGDPNRSLDFKLRFYRNSVDEDDHNPGRRGGLSYNVESDIRTAGNRRCVLLRDHIVGKALDEGYHWVAVEWNLETRKRLGGDYYTAEDEAKTDKNDRAIHATEVRWRSLPVPEDAQDDTWRDPRGGDRTRTTEGLKAIGISLVVETVHGTQPEPDPTPTPDPEPPPKADPNPGVITPPPTGAGFSACRPTVAPLTFEGGIKVSLCYDTMNGDMGDAESVYGSDNSGLLYFFERDNAEVFVKVLDGCRLNGHRWVYMAALTDVAFNMYVNDGRNPTKAYHNPSGENHALVQDQMAFPCSP